MGRKINKRIFFYLVLLVLFLSFAFSLSNISALGIGPGKIMINFSSSLEKTLDFVAVNKASSEIEVKPYVSGELVQYISCQEELLKVSANSVKPFSCKLILPEEMKAGTYESRVGLSEISSGESNVNVVLSVESRILVFVPEKNVDKRSIAIFVLFLSIVVVIFIITITKKKNQKNLHCLFLGFLGPQEFLILDGAQDFTILTCSEIKSSNLTILL